MRKKPLWLGLAAGGMLLLPAAAEAKYLAAYGAQAHTASDASCLDYYTPGYGSVSNDCATQRQVCFDTSFIAGFNSGTTPPAYATLKAYGGYATSTSTECYAQSTLGGQSSLSAYTNFSGWATSASGVINMSVYVPSNSYSLYVCCNLGPGDHVDEIVTNTF